MDPSTSDDLSSVLRDYLSVARRLESTHQTLEGEIHRLRQELKRKDRELDRRRRLAALGEMAAGVAHEVRNPLGAIQLYSNLLRKECTSLDPALKLIEKIELGIQSIETVVQSTLSLVPNRTCGSHPHRLSTIIDHALDLCRDTFERHHVSFRSNHGKHDGLLRCDQDALQRALVNLLMNAAQASPAKGLITLSISGGRPGVADADSRDADHKAGGRSIRVDRRAGARKTQSRAIRLRVRDQGPGLPDDAIDKVFDPFFTTKEKGTGLGLTLAHRLIEAHGGRLTARNHHRGGAEFTITLPVDLEDSHSDSEAPTLVAEAKALAP